MMTLEDTRRHIRTKLMKKRTASRHRQNVAQGRTGAPVVGEDGKTRRVRRVAGRKNAVVASHADQEAAGFAGAVIACMEAVISHKDLPDMKLSPLVGESDGREGWARPSKEVRRCLDVAGFKPIPLAIAAWDFAKTLRYDAPHGNMNALLKLRRKQERAALKMRVFMTKLNEEKQEARESHLDAYRRLRNEGKSALDGVKRDIIRWRQLEETFVKNTLIELGLPLRKNEKVPAIHALLQHINTRSFLKGTAKAKTMTKDNLTEDGVDLNRWAVGTYTMRRKKAATGDIMNPPPRHLLDLTPRMLCHWRKQPQYDAAKSFVGFLVERVKRNAPPRPPATKASRELADEQTTNIADEIAEGFANCGQCESWDGRRCFRDNAREDGARNGGR
jgi:hypothetical protein